MLQTEPAEDKPFAVRALGVVFVASLIALAHTTYGHFHRYSIEEQLETWHDGSQTYGYHPHPSDSFDPALYEEIRSVADAAALIRTRSRVGDERDLLYNSHDLVRARFLHFMYPHHTWLTNPVLRFLELLFPERTFNAMATADVKLRHAAAVPCGGAATTFVEVYRAVGGRAQFVTFPGPPGHQIAEAIAGGRRYLVDADLEVIAPFGVAEFVADPGLVAHYYRHRSSEEIEVLERVFAQHPVFSGYDGLPTGSPRGYTAQVILEQVKFAVPVLLAGGSLMLRLWLSPWVSWRSGWRRFRPGRRIRVEPPFAAAGNGLHGIRWEGKRGYSEG